MKTQQSLLAGVKNIQPKASSDSHCEQHSMETNKIMY